MKAIGLKDEGFHNVTINIKTVGYGPIKKHFIWLFKQREIRLTKPKKIPRPDGGYYVLPAGFQFDGGSVPRWLLVLAVTLNQFLTFEGLPEWVSWVRWVLFGMTLVGLLIEKYGLMLAAFAVHDFAVRYGVLVTDDGVVHKVDNVLASNRIMRRVNFATNDMIAIGWIAHLAVVLGAWRAWAKHRKSPPLSNWKALDYGVELKMTTTHQVGA